MDRREAQTALRLAAQWNREALLPDAGLRAIEARYARAASGDGEPFGASVLYGLGGILLGSAVFALLMLLRSEGILQDTEAAAPWLFLGWGALCAAAAFATDLGLRRPALGDAFHAAALVAVTASGFPRADELPLGFVAMAFAAGALAYRRQRVMAPLLALVALNVAWASVVFGRVESQWTDEVAFTLWFAFAAVQLVALVVASRLTRLPWVATALGLCTLLLAGTFLAFHFEVLDEAASGFDGDAEVYLAALMGAVMAGGLALREKGMVLGAALVVAIDAVAFAFDVGELVGGLAAILAVAGLLIWQAGALRRYLRED